jgi:formate dehydrogenase beta subunit
VQLSRPEAADKACRLCLVEVKGVAEPQLACKTPAAEGMIVHTNRLRLQKLRYHNLKLMLSRYPDTGITTESKETATVKTSFKAGKNEIQRAIDHIGVDEFPPYIAKKLPVREDSPFWIRDNNFCILCERCVRVCEDIRGIKAIEFAYPCHKACPAGIDIPRYLRLIARGKPSASLAVIREKVPFPGSLGRVCVHPCETACQRGKEVDKPLCIRMMKRFAADNSDDSWKKRAKRLPPTGKRVAVVGAGPAGLTAAFYLAKQGHKVTVFEALSQPGGMMRVGIPEYRLPRNILGGEIDDIKSFGVEIKLNTRVESLNSLFNQGYNAIFLGLGAHRGMSLGVEGETLPGVIESAEFLRRINLGEKMKIGNRVGVVGGGNVAIDSARISLRLGAKKVTIIYRRTRAEMPANPEEIDAALEEGIEIIYLAAPSKVTRENDVLKLQCIRMELGEPDASGRRRPVPIKGSEFVIELDTLIAAIGQRTHTPEGFKIEQGKGDVVKADRNMCTSREGVFAGGDCVSGPATVIEAIAAGRKAAAAIDRYLGGDGDIAESLVAPEEALSLAEEDLPAEKLAVFSHLHPQNRIKNFDEVELDVDWNVAVSEAARCLQCNVIAPPEKLTLKEANCKFCGACVDACPVEALTERSILGISAPDRTVTTICPYCGVGCQLNLEITDEKIIRVVPDLRGPANEGQACVKGKFGLDFVNSPDRLTMPLIKQPNGEFMKVSWNEALDFITGRLANYNGNQFAAISSAKCTNEDNFVFQKFARAVMDTNNVDHCARL